MSYEQLRQITEQSIKHNQPRKGYGYFCKDCGMGITSFSSKSVTVWHFTHDALGCIGHYNQLKRREYMGTVNMKRYSHNDMRHYLFLQDVEDTRYKIERR